MMSVLVADLDMRRKQQLQSQNSNEPAPPVFLFDVLPKLVADGGELAVFPPAVAPEVAHSLIKLLALGVGVECTDR